MLNLKWHKLDDKKKVFLRNIRPLILVMGSCYVEPERYKEIIDEDKKATVIFGVLMDEWIPGLENAEQFRPLTDTQLNENLMKATNSPGANGKYKAAKQVATLQYHFSNGKYLIRELKPDRVLWFNGTWANVLHYQSEYWESLDIGAEAEMISPFTSEASAMDYSEKLQKKNVKQFEAKWKEELSGKKKLSDEEIMKIADEASLLSWDWNGRTGAVAAKNGKILEYGYNTVLPYEAAMLHNGGIRDRMKTPIGQSLEYYQTNHAECQVINKIAASKSKTLKGADLYTSKFVCPFCARIVADTSISRVLYSTEYPNEISFKVIGASGKQTLRL